MKWHWIAGGAVVATGLVLGAAAQVTRQEFDELAKRVEAIEKQSRVNKANVSLLQDKLSDLRKSVESGAEQPETEEKQEQAAEPGRDVNIRENLGKSYRFELANTPPADAIRYLHELTSIPFYVQRSQLARVQQPVTLRGEMTLAQALNRICEQTNLVWRATDRFVQIGLRESAEPERPRETGPPPGQTDGLVGNPAPDFELRTTDGRQVSLGSLRGQVVLLDFWATWCPPCVREMPNMKRLYARYHSAGVQVLGLSLDRDEDDLEEFVGENDIPWPQVLLEGEMRERVTDAYGVNAIPRIILIDRRGVVRAENLRGERTEAAVRALLQDERR